MTDSFSRLIAEVVPLALGAAVSPVIVILQMLTLTTGRSRLARSWLVLLGALGACVVWTLLAVYVVNRLPLSTARHDPSAAAARIALALVLVSLGVRSVLHRDDHRAPVTTPDPHHGSSRLGFALLIGFAAMISNVTSLVLFLPAVHDISRARVSDDQQLLALVIVVCLTLLPALVPPLAVTIGGERARNGLDRVGAVVTAHQATISAAVCFVFAAYLGLTGFARL